VHQSRFDYRILYYIQSKSCFFGLSNGPIKIMFVGRILLFLTDMSIFYSFDLYLRMFLYNIFLLVYIPNFFNNNFFLYVKRDLILEYYIQSKSRLFLFILCLNKNNTSWLVLSVPYRYLVILFFRQILTYVCFFTILSFMKISLSFSIIIFFVHQARFDFRILYPIQILFV